MPQPTAPSGSPSAATASDPPAPADDGGAAPAPEATEAPAAPAPAPAPPPASAPEPTPAPTETVVRPDPGLARGVWEAPPWAFWVALGLVVVIAAGYVAARAGLLKRKRAADAEAPKSRRRP